MIDMADMRDRRARAHAVEDLADGPAQGPEAFHAIPVILSDISVRGARISGEGLPEQNELVMLRADNLTIEARVAWSIGTACGVEFQNPLPPECAATLERRGLRGLLFRTTK